MNYSIKKDKILELDIRKGIYEFIVKFPGTHFREIERKLRLPATTVKYHLNFLSKNEIVNEKKIGNKICYYGQEFQVKNSQLMGLLRQESIRKILFCLLSIEKCNQAKIAEKTSLTPSTISWHLKRLEDLGVIAYTKNGKGKEYKALIKKDEIQNLLITYRKTFFDTMVDRMIEMWEK